MSNTIKVPRLSKGKGFKGPDFYGCFNTGTAPAIFHSRTGKFIVGPEMRCRDAMREFLLLGNKRTVGTGRDKCWIFKGRAGAVKKFMALCGPLSCETIRYAKSTPKPPRERGRAIWRLYSLWGDY